MEEKILSVTLPDGRTLTVEPTGDENYPGFVINVDGSIMTSVEYSCEDKELKTYCHTSGIKEPFWIIDYNRGRDVA